MINHQRLARRQGPIIGVQATQDGEAAVAQH
eukprot:CAMPEP_0198696596 /NCGR_PEP_ID=MMETSP1468-20131203/309183_1 /TAXON_ID=1461545 /ORGANISM="Mantoniella sp, Strain CCMP1436" /LENGTH=30 /DNA_ID= /DNA_START= /DNA_END= /DNA_ORIENTATION=